MDAKRKKMNTMPVSARKWTFIFLFAIAQAVIAAWPLFHSGWVATWDGYMHIQRVQAVSYAVKHGDFYPRWTTAAAAGKGSPFLNFYSPGFYLAAGYLHAMGIQLVPAVKIVCMLMLFAGWLGMFLWAKGHFDIPGALIAATVFMFAPYHFHDLYQRGSLPELAAVNLMPFLFYGIDLMCAQNRRYMPGIIVTALATALITLTHNLMGFMIAPFAALYIGWLAFSSGAPARVFPRAATGVALGMGLSAFYWLPVLTEIGYLARFKEATLDGYPYYKLFMSAAGWFKAGWTQPPKDLFDDLQIGYALLGFDALAIAALFAVPRQKRGFGLIVPLLGILALFMTIPLSGFLYKYLTPLQYVLFPWSYMGIATLFFSVLAGYSASLIPAGRMRFGPAALVCIALALCVFVSSPQRTAYGRLAIKDDIPNIMGIAPTDEFRPRWETMPVTAKRYDFLYTTGSSTNIKEASANGTEIRVLADAAGPANLIITQFYFPGWRLRIDGRGLPVSTTPEGFITFGIPPGLHLITLWFGTTWPRVTGWVISVVASLAILVGTLKKAGLLKALLKNHYGKMHDAAAR